MQKKILCDHKNNIFSISISIFTTLTYGISDSLLALLWQTNMFGMFLLFFFYFDYHLICRFQFESAITIIFRGILGMEQLFG